MSPLKKLKLLNIPYVPVKKYIIKITDVPIKRNPKTKQQPMFPLKNP
jgi:hypothetical protein